jgi:hypothetical protein
MNKKLMKFKIVSPRDVQSIDNTFETLLLNMDHVVSIKPIKMVIEDRVVDGYWIRTTNGKKYRAVEVPSLIKDLLSDDQKSDSLNSVINEDVHLSQVLN